MKIARAKRAKLLIVIVKYANLWRFCHRRLSGCLSSLLTAVRGVTFSWPCVLFCVSKRDDLSKKIR